MYINDVLKHTVEAGRTEAIIDSIREQGEFQIKLRTFDAYGESEDSNVVVTRYRRHDSSSADTKPIHRTQSDHLIDDVNLNQLRQTQSQGNLGLPTKMDQSTTPDRNEHISPMTSSPSHSNSSESGNRLKSSGSSPHHQEKNELIRKRSPTRAGIMSRFSKSPHRVKGNNVLLNALPIHFTPSPIETSDSIQSALHSNAVSSSMTIPLQNKTSLDPNSL